MRLFYLRFLAATSLCVLLLMQPGCDQLRQAVQSSGSSMENPETYPFDFSLLSVDGNIVSKSDFEGKVLVVDIWGTWCPPCRDEVPHFVELQEELGPQGLQMVGINYENADTPSETIAEIKAFTDSTPVNYPLLLGTEEIQQQIPNFGAFPTTVFIDREGNVRLTLVGARSKRELKTIMTQLLSESA